MRLIRDYPYRRAPPPIPTKNFKPMAVPYQGLWPSKRPTEVFRLAYRESGPAPALADFERSIGADIDIRPGPCYIIIMEEERKNRNLGVWLWLIPVFIIAAWPAYRWMKKANSGDLDLSRDEYSVFNSQDGEVRKTEKPAAGDPGLDEGIMGVRYKSKATAAREEQAAAEERAQERVSEQKRAEGHASCPALWPASGKVLGHSCGKLEADGGTVSRPMAIKTAS